MVAKLQQKSWLDENKTEVLNKIEQGLLPHALLLLGSHLAGQEELGLWLSSLLLCEQQTLSAEPCGHCKTCLLVKANTHPDLQVIDNAEKTIGVDLVRQAGSFLQKTAHLAKNKVVLVLSAENMTEAAANALLKTLEEPTDNSYLLLVCNEVEMLLPTIISRCNVIQIKPPTGEQLAALVADKSLINQFSNITELAELTDDKTQQQRQEIIEQLNLFLQSFDNGNELSHLLSSNLNGLRWLTNAFQQLIRIQSGWQDALAQHEMNIMASRYSNEQLWQCLTLINQATKQIKLLTQANKTFTIEALLVDIEQQLLQ
ncbi:hypothetical protein [Thalassotalea sp. ND16A]|uniref:hypothetical protein n=1 Tax=Thalassotalea sp. ND16A TaxID=1535422 RepID=UPI00051D5FFF|nr:hypothetical protein [Thalassotalea sp. ND16A]KGJ92758.1 hypothetical protein ND16A_1560 [Thalassotalea sp. ND16A]